MTGPTPGVLPVRALTVLLVIAVTLTLTWRLGRSGDSVPGSPARHVVTLQMQRVQVVPERRKVPGYLRRCGGDRGCVFGPAWSDHTDAPGSGNGCSTRQDVLLRDVRGAAPEAGQPCRIVGGILVDPYTGRRVDLRVSGLRAVHVDHVFPLAAAWDLGASRWSPALRARFANDVELNLLAVSAQVNTDKGDATPERWMPPDPRRHCFYASRYLSVALAYDLAVTDGDLREIRRAAHRCPVGGS